MITTKKAALSVVLFLIPLFASCGESPSSDPEVAELREPRGEGEVCGTIAHYTCQDDLFCKNPTGQCDVYDGGGTCTKVPEICTEESAPVCGCDGKTYGNTCKADMASVSVDHEGEC